MGPIRGCRLGLLAPLATILLLAGSGTTLTLAAETKSKPVTTSKTKTSEKAKTAKAKPLPPAKPRPGAAPVPAPVLSGSLGELQNAVKLVDAGDSEGALSAADQLRDPAARALVRWLALRTTARGVGFDRALAILREHPTLPTPTVLRRRLEYLLYAENRDAATTFNFFNGQPPISGEGKIALARAFFASGDRANGAAWLRDAWREDTLSDEAESTVLVEFGGVLTRADHKYRADRLLYAEDTSRGLRAAQRAGDDVVALARVRIALATRKGDPAKLLAAVPFSLKSDPAYIYAQAKILRRADDNAGAARALLSAPKNADALIDAGAWWIERRLVARELLDAGDARTAFRVAAEAALPENDHLRAEQQFTAGWIALRFLGDARTAQQYFARIPESQDHPATIARGYYWQGRAAEALGSMAGARGQYENAARYSTTYYGQIARARLGLSEVAVHGAPSASAAQRAAFNADEGVQIFRLLEQIGKRDLAAALAIDLAERLPDAASVGLLADTAASKGDARAMVAIGKTALSRGLPVEAEAYPTIGIPKYQPIGPEVDRALVYAIARQESMFNATVVSHAGATGLMQVMPATGKTIARRTGAKFDIRKLAGDPSTNVQFGAAELGDLLQNYDGNYILTFAAYNAGRGNVAKWIAQYGDPRDPAIDPIDWAERIPFSETRNYVQRVMENAQIYKARFHNSRNTLQIEADLRGTRVN